MKSDKQFILDEVVRLDREEDKEIITIPYYVKGSDIKYRAKLFKKNYYLTPLLMLEGFSSHQEAVLTMVTFLKIEKERKDELEKLATVAWSPYSNFSKEFVPGGRLSTYASLNI